MNPETWHWRFFGFVSPAGNWLVQEWFDSLSEGAQEEMRDTVGYLQKLPNHLWRRPKYDPLPGETVSEIRFDTESNTYRIYGFCGPEGYRRVYTFLYGTDKKIRNDRKGKQEAANRRKQIERGEARFHEFEFGG